MRMPGRAEDGIVVRAAGASAGMGACRTSGLGGVAIGEGNDHDQAEEPGEADQQLRGDVDHLLIASSLPILLPPSIHDVEAWNEALCAGAWGPVVARVGERLRRLADLEHWAAFSSSFARLSEIVRAVAAGERGDAPATIGFLSGDVHYAYVAEVSGGEEASVIYQAVCSPFRNSLPAPIASASRAAMTAAAVRLARALARAAGIDEPPVPWRVTSGPFFANQLATLTLDGRTARLRLERADNANRLATTLEREISTASLLAEPEATITASRREEGRGS